MTNVDEQLDGSAKEDIYICAETLRQCAAALNAALAEMSAIETQYLRAVNQPKLVAFDTIAPLGDRIAKVRENLAKVLL